MTKRTLIAMLSGWCVACSPDAPVPLTVLHQGSQCSMLEEGIKQITDPSAIAGYIRPPIPPGLESLEAVEEVPWKAGPEDKIFMVSMGQQTSGGYSVTLSAETGRIVDDTLELPMALEQPEPDSMQTQQVTTPCMIIAAGPGSYKSVKVLGHHEWRIPVR